MGYAASWAVDREVVLDSRRSALEVLDMTEVTCPYQNASSQDPTVDHA